MFTLASCYQAAIHADPGGEYSGPPDLCLPSKLKPQPGPLGCPSGESWLLPASGPL